MKKPNFVNKTLKYKDINYSLSISNLDYKDNTTELSLPVYGKEYNEAILMDINYTFLDFMFKDLNDNFTFINKADNQSYTAVNLPEELFEEAKTMVNIYEYFFGTNAIDRINWNLFKHICDLTENEEVIESGKQTLDTFAILSYSNCFIMEKDNSDYKINYSFLDMQKKEYELLNYSTSEPIEISRFVCRNTMELLICFLTHFFRYNPNKEFKKCENCDKWFISDKKGTKYCNRISPQYQNKNCKEAMTLINKLNNQNSNAISRLRRNVRNKYYNPVNIYGREKDIERLRKFDEEDKKWRENLSKGKTTLKEYEEWLRIDNYANKKRNEVK